ncbi:Glycerol-3-phosphate dehydrogenase [NAD(P)+] [Planctomycetes bacterium Pan216]|uniref:Glycerol-3-phosphate dehydrogenase [NAD(P)+] n=1 Tax=Kolteria novifilia TaxID=2527975 RepID=A0A518BB89_9BACT|nr:Glycerol-3-phosphate dehydrogenase [NAD(P)+] [Planctomycetes bacterium Pan216]
MRFTILGDGAMGTACALLLAEQPSQEATIWSNFDGHCQLLEKDRENKKFLPGVPIPDKVSLTSDIATANNADAFVVAIPTVYLADTLGRIADQLPSDKPFISVVKGMERETFRSPSQIISQCLGDPPIAVLSGPSHAEEIARGMPASVVAASGDLRLAECVQQWFTTDRFRVYTSLDLRGTELSAALKNVIAIAAGICDGLKFGDNAKSALMTRGLVEMTRFGIALGAEEETYYGLAGLGDLFTTCVSPHGRNRRVGQKLGEGMTLEEILAETEQVAEGVETCRSVHDLARKKGIDMPLTEEIYKILFAGKRPLEAVEALMNRPLKQER